MDSRDNAPRGPRKARGRPRDWHDKTEQNTVKSLDRAMEVFEFLSEHQGMALSTISDRMGQSPSTIYRVLVTLEGRGLVEFAADEQLWHIGSRAFIIGSKFLRRTSLVERARPVMRALMEATGETANLGAEKEGSVLFLSQVETYANIAHAMYEDSLLTAETLRSAVGDLVAKPSQATLVRARAAWLAARQPYQQTEGFRFGNPAVDDWEGKVNAWPLDEGLIDYVSEEYEGPTDENEYAALNIIATPQATIAGQEVDASEITPELITLQEVQ